MVPHFEVLQELYDVLAQREADQEAFCAVCGDGHSGEQPWPTGLVGVRCPSVQGSSPQCWLLYVVQAARVRERRPAQRKLYPSPQPPPSTLAHPSLASLSRSLA